MNLKLLLLILISFVGILSAFLPWVYYPIIDKSLYGYLGAGAISSSLFVLYFFSAYVGCIKQRQLGIIVAMCLSLLICFIAYTAYSGFLKDKADYHVESQAIAKVAAGFEMGIGIWLLIGASIASLAFVVINFMLLKNTKGIVALLALCSISSCMDKPLDKQQVSMIKDNVLASVTTMNTHYANNEMTQYIECLHPALVEYLGGKKNLNKYITEINQAISTDGKKMLAISDIDISLIEKNQGHIVVQLSQKYTYLDGSDTLMHSQKLLGVTKNAKDGWRYIDVTMLTPQRKEDIQKIIPEIKNFL